MRKAKEGQPKRGSLFALMRDSMIIDVIIPTYKPDERFIKLVKMMEKQTVEINKMIVINTEERYMNALHIGTHFLSEHKKLYISHISAKEFDHGKTRNRGAFKSDADILVFMTQDAVPEDEKLIENLIAPLKDGTVACSYARQLPAPDATVTERLTREFNYPAESVIKSGEDKKKLGIKTYFCSNVCCAYNGKIFRELKGFVNYAIFNEDMIYAAKVVEKGYRVAYAADAKVIHSHNYSGKQQFHRNFDLGVSQADHPEVFEGISSESEGIRMVKETIRRLKEANALREIPGYIYTSGCKYIGYRLGKNYGKLPKWLILKCTMSPIYWKKKL